ncbi:MAG: hypothetical protein ABR962_06675 [Candidatus Bathyarchaeia archaeon]
MQRIRCHTIDLTRISGGGEFRCPKCGTEMSPDDETAKVYTIVETVIEGGSLERVILRCNKCRSQIQLIGFDFLNETQRQFKQG